jgi:hypothetical protein
MSRWQDSHAAEPTNSGTPAFGGAVGDGVGLQAVKTVA